MSKLVCLADALNSVASHKFHVVGQHRKLARKLLHLGDGYYATYGYKRATADEVIQHGYVEHWHGLDRDSLHSVAGSGTAIMRAATKVQPMADTSRKGGMRFTPAALDE